jgi:hypothetical protein
MNSQKPLLLLSAICLCLLAHLSAKGAWGADETPTLRVLRGMPVHYSDRDEPADSRGKRLERIAHAIDGATDDKLERAMLVIMAARESHLARFVDLDEPPCREGHKGSCDSGRAWSIFQMHGTDRTGTRRDAANIAIEHLRRAGNYCASRGHDRVIGSYALYGSGKWCSTSSAKERALAAKQLVGKL